MLGGLAMFFLWPMAKLTREFLFGPVNVFTVILNRGPELKNDNGRTNILLLGIGGATHDGPNLTDAIMVLSFKAPGPLTIISVPRDIYLDSLGDKINSAYQIGLDSGVGTTLAKAVVSQVTGLPIHYAVVADFSAFDDIVNILGGIDVTVEHLLDDPAYPIDGKESDNCGFSVEEEASRAAALNAQTATEKEAFPCRYELLHFDVGTQHMDGTIALKFVRSRHAQGDEGTDFARSRRQQLVLSALKSKVLSSETFLNPKKIWQLYDQLKSHINSDLSQSEVNMLINTGLKYRGAQIKMTAIGQDFLENPPVDYRGWILLPKDGTWDQVHEFVKKSLAIGN